MDLLMIVDDSQRRILQLVSTFSRGYPLRENGFGAALFRCFS
jgi:hypothetical protein